MKEPKKPGLIETLKTVVPHLKEFLNERCAAEAVDTTQKHAWRLVRAAEDRFGNGVSGQEKRAWALRQMKKTTKINNGVMDDDWLEDFVRAAHVNFCLETGRNPIKEATK